MTISKEFKNVLEKKIINNIPKKLLKEKDLKKVEDIQLYKKYHGSTLLSKIVCAYLVTLSSAGLGLMSCMPFIFLDIMLKKQTHLMFDLQPFITSFIFPIISIFIFIYQYYDSIYMNYKLKNFTNKRKIKETINETLEDILTNNYSDELKKEALYYIKKIEFEKNFLIKKLKKEKIIPKFSFTDCTAFNLLSEKIKLEYSNESKKLTKEEKTKLEIEQMDLSLINEINFNKNRIKT